MTLRSSDDSSHVKRLRLPAAAKGLRLDRALASELPELSRMHLQELIGDGRVLVDGEKITKPGTLVAGEHAIEVSLAPRRKLRREPTDPCSLVVLFEDEHLIVVNKPPGLLAHPTATSVGGSVSDLAAARYGALPTLQGADRPGIVHRLDAGTSGVMVLARTPDAFRRLMDQFRDRSVEKTYLALVYGEPRFDSGWIEAPIARDEKDPGRMAVAPAGEGRDARTFYTVVERLRGLALVQALPKSGRTHQIRVHLASISMPLVGDKLYRRRGGPSLRLPPDAPVPARQCLHAWRLRFTHPISGEAVSFEAPPAEDFERMLAWARAQLGAK